MILIILKSSFDFCTFYQNMSKGFFFFYYNHFPFIVFHKPSDADGKRALVCSGLASRHLTVICWSCAIAWWLSSSKATGPFASQPITAPQHSAVDNYRSVCVTTSLSSIWKAQYKLLLQSVMFSSLLFRYSRTEIQWHRFCLSEIPGKSWWTCSSFSAFMISSV